MNEDTIDLRELFTVLKRRKKLIWLVTGLFTLLALVYVLLATPWWQAKATVEIGRKLQKSNTGMLIPQYFSDTKKLEQYLNIKYDTTGKYKDKNSTGYIKSITLPKKSNAFINITAYAHSNNEAVKILKKPIDDIVHKDKIYYDAILTEKQDRLEKLHQNFVYNKNSILPQLKQSLAFLKTVGLKKINDKIKLIKSIQLKKISDKIKVLKTINIVTLNNKKKQCEAEILNKKTSVQSMRKEIFRVVKREPSLAAMSAMQMANLENDIAHLNTKIIDIESQIQIIREETIPNLEKDKMSILEESIPTIKAQKRKLLEQIIPAKEAEIEKMTSITLPGIQTQIKEIKMSMKEPYLVMSHIVHKIYTQDKPVKPKKALILIIAFITGLMLSVFLAFFLEFLQDSKKEN